MKKAIIICTSDTQRRIVTELLKDKYTWVGITFPKSKSVEEYIQKHKEGFPNIIVRGEMIDLIDGRGVTKEEVFEFSQLDEFIDYINAPEEIEVKLDGVGMARVTKTDFFIYHLKFPISFLDDLMAAKNKLKD